MLMSKDLSKSARPAEPAATEGPSFDAQSAGGPDGGADQGQDSGAGKADKADKAPPARTQAQLLEASLLLSHWVEVDAFPAAPSLLSVPVAPALATGGGGGGAPPAAPSTPGGPAAPPDSPESPNSPDSPDDKNPNRGGAGAL